MADNLHLSLSLADIARAADLSSFHFLRVFKAATGQTPHRYLNGLRLRSACRHLESGDAAGDRDRVPVRFQQPGVSVGGTPPSDWHLAHCLLS